MAGADRDLAAALLRHAESRARAAVAALRSPSYAAACYRDAAVVKEKHVIAARQERRETDED